MTALFLRILMTPFLLSENFRSCQVPFKSERRKEKFVISGAVWNVSRDRGWYKRHRVYHKWHWCATSTTITRHPTAVLNSGDPEATHRDKSQGGMTLTDRTGGNQFHQAMPQNRSLRCNKSLGNLFPVTLRSNHKSSLNSTALPTNTTLKP